MTLTQEITEIASASYRLTTDGKILKALPWQNKLYDQLSALDSDAGYLFIAATGLGKTETVVIPSLGLHRGGAPRRLFIIAPDDAPLDDYVYRLVPYLRASAAGDGVPRTLYLDADKPDDEQDQCTRYFSDGSVDTTIARNPLEADVDLVLTTFARFHELFFGGGGIHALPSSLVTEEAQELRRDLFFFDEAHAYTSDGFSRFHRLVEFLFAQDMDIVVGSSTMPAPYQEELSFLEMVLVPEDDQERKRTLTYLPSSNVLEEMEAEIRHSYYQNARVIGVLETSEEAEALYGRLISSYPHSVYVYNTAEPQAARQRIYAQLRELEKEGEGYLLLTTGNAIEVSDLDATLLLTTLCPPENLIRRAGRCNRRGDLPEARIVMFGSEFAHTTRILNATQATDYLQALREQDQTPFSSEFWKIFI